MKYITVKQLYERLNSECPGIIGINAVYELVKKKDFPSIRVGNKFLIIEDKVDAWFEKKSFSYKR
jgi:excisionase family DNA binding protein